MNTYLGKYCIVDLPVVCVVFFFTKTSLMSTYVGKYCIVGLPVV